MVIAEWVVWLNMSVWMFLFFFWEAASISAWRASRLNNTTGDSCCRFITICVDSDGTSEKGCSSIKVHHVIPVVVVSETTGTCSYLLSREVSISILSSKRSAISGQVTISTDLKIVHSVDSICSLFEVLEGTLNSDRVLEMAKGWRIELHPSVDFGAGVWLKDDVGAEILREGGTVGLGVSGLS